MDDHVADLAAAEAAYRQARAEAEEARQRRAAVAARAHDAGMSYRAIARALGVFPADAVALVKLGRAA